MPADSTPRQELAGERIAFSGRLASLTRAEAETFVRARGGDVCRSVSSQTTLLVIGEGGWPLRRDGRVARNLQRARALARAGAPISIVREEQFLERVGLAGSAAPIVQRYTLAQLAGLLRASLPELRRWLRLGLIRPEAAADGVAWFDYRQAAGAKTLSALARGGVSTSRLRRSLEQLQRWRPEFAEPLAQLAMLEHTGGRLAVRGDDGRLLEPGGQRLLDFDSPAPPSIRLRDTDGGAAELFAAAVAHEEEGDCEAAAALYERLLDMEGPDADIYFNLGNAWAAQGRSYEAAAAYGQAVTFEPGFAPAWNNLGNVLADLGRVDEAVAALERAVAADPRDEDARYNLAALLDDAGRGDEALPHWRLFLRTANDGPRTDYARERARQSADSSEPAGSSG